MVDKAILDAIDLPFEEAIAFFRQKARVPTDHWTDVWRSAHSHSFMVAGAATDDLLADFQKSIAKALASGTTLAEFRQDFDQIVSKHGWAHNGSAAWRSRIIYETNLSTAYSAGRYAQLTEPETLKTFPIWQYQHSGSRHPRIQHLNWNGLCLRADDAFWATHYPPNGWRCGCRVRPLTEGGLKRLGKSEPDKAPDNVTRPWTNPKTGKTTNVPVGIDPGFDYNPGLAWQRGAKAIPTSADDLGRLASVRRAPGGAPALPPAKPATEDELRAWAAEPRGKIIAGRLPDEAMAALGAESDLVQLSDESMRKQQGHHSDLTPDDYAALPALIGSPTMIVTTKEANKLAFLSQRHIAIVKVTGDRQENFLSSLTRGRLRDRQRKAAKGRAIKGSIDDLV